MLLIKLADEFQTSTTTTPIAQDLFPKVIPGGSFASSARASASNPSPLVFRGEPPALGYFRRNRAALTGEVAENL